MSEVCSIYRETVYKNDFFDSGHLFGCSPYLADELRDGVFGDDSMCGAAFGFECPFGAVPVVGRYGCSGVKMSEFTR